MREVKGWSQVELGKRAGVRQATISHLESGNAKAVDLAVLEKIAKALGVAPGYLIVKKQVDGVVAFRPPRSLPPLQVQHLRMLA